MDDTFSFRAAPLPLRRRIEPRMIKVAVAAIIVVFSVVAFARWVVQSERQSEAAAAGLSEDEALVGRLQGSDAAEGAGQELRVTDAPARADARTAMAAARDATRGRATFAEAGPGELSTLVRSLVFTDGPSTAPGIVSVATSGDRWAGAVLGASGTCYWITLTPGGPSFDSGRSCTGVAALSADDRTWA